MSANPSQSAELFAAFVEWDKNNSNFLITNHLELFSDGSGRVLNSRGEWIFEFAHFDEAITKLKAANDGKTVASKMVDGPFDKEEEELLQNCVEIIKHEQKASVSLFQRRLRLGYTRAARIMDELENRGIVGPSKGAEPRDILIEL